VSEIAERGGKAFAMQGDVSKSDDVKQLFAEVCVSSAGWMGWSTTPVCIRSVAWSRSPRRSFTASTTRMYRNAAGDAGSGEVVWREGRQHHQHRNRWHAESGSSDGSVAINENLNRHNHPGFGEGAWAEEDPHKLDQSRWHGDRGRSLRSG